MGRSLRTRGDWVGAVLYMAGMRAAIISFDGREADMLILAGDEADEPGVGYGERREE